MNRTLPAALACLALQAGCADQGACSLAKATSVPLTLAANGTRLIVPAMLDGRQLTLIVDTGAIVTLLSRTAMNGQDTWIGQGTLGGVGGSTNVDAMRLTRLELGTLHGGVTAAVTDKVFKVDHHPVDGLLGMNVMGGYDVDLDVASGRLGLYATHGDCSKPNVPLGGTLYAVAEQDAPVQQLAPRVALSINGKNLTAILDAGAQGTAMFRSGARRLGLSEADLAKDPAVMAGGVGRDKEHAHVHMIDQIGIGDLQLRHVPVAVIDQEFDPDVDMLLGMDFIRRVHVWISNSSHSLILQYPPVPVPVPVPASVPVPGSPG